MRPLTLIFLLLTTPTILLLSIWNLLLSPSSRPSIITSSLLDRQLDDLHNKQILLLIAHPDDESMFFAPTLQALTQPQLQNHVQILCLSTGNADGLGPTRAQEIETAALTLGLASREDVAVVDDESRFKDGMDQLWEPAEIARAVAAEAEKLKKAPRSGAGAGGDSTAGATGEGAAIDVLITFDREGISSHPNHQALYHGAQHFISSASSSSLPTSSNIKLYTLTSVNILRKYSGALDILTTLLSSYSSSSLKRTERGPDEKANEAKKVFISDLTQYLNTRQAMTAGHKSQMVWFRWGWILLSRYMYINELEVVAAPLQPPPPDQLSENVS